MLTKTLFQHIECSYSLRPLISLQKGNKMLQILLVCLVICCSNAPFSITSNFAKHSRLHFSSFATCSYNYSCIHINIIPLSVLDTMHTTLLLGILNKWNNFHCHSKHLKDCPTAIAVKNKSDRYQSSFINHISIMFVFECYCCWTVAMRRCTWAQTEWVWIWQLKQCNH